MTRVREWDAQKTGQQAEDAGGAVAALPEPLEERSPLEPAVIQGREPGWEELLQLADRVGPSAELATVDDRALQRLVCTGAARVAAEMCHWLDLIAELVIRRLWADEGARTPAAWLSWAVGMSPSAARDHVRVALRLRELPKVREEFAAGRISYSKVRAITRVAVPEIEPLLLDWSRMATGADMERIVAGFRTAQRGAMPGPGPAELARRVTLRGRGDGTSDVVIRMPDDEAHALYAGAQRLVDLEDAELRREAGAVGVDGCEGDDELALEGTVPLSLDETGMAEPPVDAHGHVDARDGAGPSDSAKAAPVAAMLLDDRPRSARLADAVLQAVQDAVAAGGPDTTGADRHTLVVHVDDDDLAPPGEDHATGGTVATETRQGAIPALSRRTLRRMACEAGIVLVSRDRDGTPIDVGRRQRHLTTALRRALLDRDRSCRFPGCGARRHLHGHHIQHWSDEGPTDLANLVLICSFHHRYVHDHEIDVRLRPHAAHEFRFPDGRRIARVRPLPGLQAGSTAAHRAPGLPGEADGDVLKPVDWDGKHCLDTTVAVLQQQVHAVLPHAAGVLAA